MSSVAELSDGTALQPFVDMAKTLKDPAALCGFVKQVLSQPGVYVFGELLELDNIKSVSCHLRVVCTVFV